MSTPSSLKADIIVVYVQVHPSWCSIYQEYIIRCTVSDTQQRKELTLFFEINETYKEEHTVTKCINFSF